MLFLADVSHHCSLPGSTAMVHVATYNANIYTFFKD